jgi:hypothetical protein
MKHSLIFAICVAVLLTAVPAFAQINVNYTSALNRVTYVAAEADTGTVAGQYVAGANLLSLVVTVEDSCELDIVVQYKTNGTWTTVLTDSLISTVAAGATKEWSIRDSDSDLLDGIYYPVRVIVTGQATGNGVTTPYVTARWYYRL